METDASSVLREDYEAFLVEYATALCDCEATADAEAPSREAINRRWSVKLAVGYGMLGGAMRLPNSPPPRMAYRSTVTIRICC